MSRCSSTRERRKSSLECLGTSHLLEGVGWWKWGGVIPFCAPQNGGLHDILQPFRRGHAFLCIPISFPQKRKQRWRNQQVQYCLLSKWWQTCETVNLCPFSKDIRAATLTFFIGISPSDSSWRLNQILFISSSLSLLCLSLICFFERFLDLNFRMCSGNILTFFSLYPVDVNAVLGISFPQHCHYWDPVFKLSPRVLSYVSYKWLTEGSNWKRRS